MLVAAALAACTYPGTVPPAPVAAAEVMPGRAIAAPTAISLAADPALLDREVPPINGCEASRYPLTLSPALRATLDAVNRRAFPQQVPADGTYQIRIALESYEPRLLIADGTFGVLAIADIDVTLAVRATDRSGAELLRTTVEGHGTAQVDADCGAGAQALEQAASAALRRLGETYADRVVNAGPLR